MKTMKLTGREMAVLRAIDTMGNTGEEITERTQILLDELSAILSGLCEVGYVEGYRPGADIPSMDPVPTELVLAARFEINPSYAQELKKAIARR